MRKILSIIMGFLASFKGEKSIPDEEYAKVHSGGAPCDRCGCTEYRKINIMECVCIKCNKVYNQ